MSDIDEFEDYGSYPMSGLGLVARDNTHRLIVYGGVVLLRAEEIVDERWPTNTSVVVAARTAEGWGIYRAEESLEPRAILIKRVAHPVMSFCEDAGEYVFLLPEGNRIKVFGEEFRLSKQYDCVRFHDGHMVLRSGGVWYKISSRQLDLVMRRHRDRVKQRTS